MPVSSASSPDVTAGSIEAELVSAALVKRSEGVPLPGNQSHVTNRLAQFVAGSQWETIPSEVRREGVRGLLNFVGCALGGAQDEALGIAVKVLTPFFGP